MEQPQTTTFRVRAMCECDQGEIFELDVVPTKAGYYDWWAFFGAETFLCTLLAHGLATGKATFKLERVP